MLDSEEPVPTWFPATNNDRFPPDGDIVLGSIITNPKQPENSLNNPLQLVVIPEVLFSRTLADKNHSSNIEKMRGYAAGIQMKLADFVDSELSHGWKNSKTRGIDAARIESKNFRPSEEYVAEAVAKPAIVAHLERQFGYFKKKAPGIFMITGLKIAHEATLHRSGEASTTSNAKASGDVAGMHMAAGPFGSRDAEDKYTYSFEPDGAFVYAVRLKRFVFRKKDAVLDNEYYTAGAEIHGDDKKRVAEQKYEIEMVSAEDVTVETSGVAGMIGRLVLDEKDGLSTFAVMVDDD